MPSRSNPNTPSSRKPKNARTLKSKRQNTQRLAANKITKPTPRTSQAIRKAAPLSRKKARKVDKKIGYAKKREMQEAGEVIIKDVDDMKRGRGDKKQDLAEDAAAKMDVDGVE